MAFIGQSGRRRWLKSASGWCVSALVPSLSAQAQTAATPGQMVRYDLCVEARKRSFLFYRPAGCHSGQPWPLLIALHPFLYPNRRFEKYANLRQMSEIGRFLLAMPQGEGFGMYRSFNAGLRDDANDPNDFLFISAVVSQLQSSTLVDSTRIYAMGMSNGAMMASLLPQQLPGLVAGIVCVSGTPAAPVRADASSIPVMIVHGTADPITPWQGPGRNTPRFIKFQDVDATLAQWRVVNKADFDPEISIYDTTDDKTSIIRYDWNQPRSTADLSLIRIEGGGHRWPSYVKKPFFSPFTGRQSTDIDMNAIAWEFLSRQKRLA